ncbi:MAG: CPBP family intramembrane metalloprotease [Acidobacteriota bacterium]|nr:CPBP family intramembrane metalloprotease [Acidobacteriota bacterium]
MRIPTGLAWLMVVMTLATASLLRQYNAGTPESPYVPPIVGSLLFAAIFVLLLVTARERQRGAVPGPGLRLGTITPLLLMLLVEKWLSLYAYGWFFSLFPSRGGSILLDDARYRAFAGIALIGVCLLVAAFSVPTARKVMRRARPARFLRAAGGTGAVILATYFSLYVLASLRGARFELSWPEPSEWLIWALVGQALLAFGEEAYYRGLLMGELERLAPRLRLSTPPARRWFALLATSLLFGVEHILLQPPWTSTIRQLLFTVCLGVLFGLIVMISANLHFSAGIHAWINWLLLGAAPHFVGSDGQPALPPGAYIAVMLVFAFFVAYVLRRRRAHYTSSVAPVSAVR